MISLAGDMSVAEDEASQVTGIVLVHCHKGDVIHIIIYSFHF